MAGDKYTLIYFNLRGRGEVARYLFTLAGVPFEDRRIERSQWPEIKPTTPFGQMPLLEVNGEVFCQSQGINRYLAREFGFYGSDATEGLEIDQVIGILAEIQQKTREITMVLQGEEKEKVLRCMQDTDVPKLLIFLEAKLGDRQWFVGDSVTLADLAVFEVLTAPVTRLTGTGWRQGSARLAALVDRVAALPALAAYVACRPVTPM